ncbi:16S rRNA (cytosine(1402)-N(4))-methyltransferase RsmH [Candidatus Saccharibacteria bacterium]|nr:16S rRNA (cytosine(1402)-N(4))-methyltransferase RsmH [Candidatus Saccharibacteria bacterium]
MPKSKDEFAHQPVLIQEVIDCLQPRLGQSYLDLTAGYGGHSQVVLDTTKAPGETVLVDRDEQAIAALKKRFAGSAVQIRHSDYLSALQALYDSNKRFDMILADLGVSSPHLDDARRGFSFNLPGPLDMRMDRTQEVQAAHYVNEASEAELTEILRKYGEEPKAGAIARAVISSRPVEDTAQLATIIAKTIGWRARRAKTHPATKSFQALRLAVNDELAQLEQGLPLMVGLLKTGGRLAIISFHSLEDRLVKQFLADKAGNRYDTELILLTKKPITASREEIVSNPRARSAKLRAAAKNKNQ